MKKSFIMHLDSLDILDLLSSEQAGELFMAIRNYHLNKINPENPLGSLGLELSSEVKIALIPMIKQFERDQEKWEARAQRSRENGARGGRPRNPDKPTGFSRNPEEPRKPVNVNVNGISKDIHKGEKPKKRFIPPSIPEVEEYKKEKNLTLDVETFINHYEANGWMVGKNKMKDWKAACRNWSSRNKHNGGSKPREDNYPNWQAFAKQQNLNARPGETWEAFEQRVKRSMRQ